MKRRQLLRLLATGAAFQLAPRQLMVMLGEARALLASQPSARTLNAHEEATVKVMAEAILPRTNTPGAADVGAVAFIDLVLTEWYDEADRKRFLAGIADVDARSNAIFGKDFVDCQTIQQSRRLDSRGRLSPHRFICVLFCHLADRSRAGLVLRPLPAILLRR